jgi:predicted molibdopterin-dependent oxidoreductase YjgC
MAVVANHNRLCVKGRFGFIYAVTHSALTKPLIHAKPGHKDRPCWRN